MNATEKEPRNPANGFVFLRSYYEAMQNLPDEYRLELLDAMLHYVFQGDAPKELSPLIQCSFTLLVPNIDSSIRRYAANTENGRKGGRPSKQPHEDVSPENPTETQLKPNQNQDKDMDMDKDTDRDRDTDKDTDKDTDTEMEMETEKEAEREKDTGHQKGREEMANAQNARSVKKPVGNPASPAENPVDYPVFSKNASTEFCTPSGNAPMLSTHPVNAPTLPTHPAEKAVDIPDPDFSHSVRDADTMQQDAFRECREQLLRRLRRLPV